MTVLTMAAGLLLILVLDIRSLADCLAECDLRLLGLDLHLIFVLQTILNDIELQIAAAVQQRLVILSIIDSLEGRILCHDLLQSLLDLVDLILLHCPVADVGIRL